MTSIFIKENLNKSCYFMIALTVVSFLLGFIELRSEETIVNVDGLLVSALFLPGMIFSTAQTLVTNRVLVAHNYRTNPMSQDLFVITKTLTYKLRCASLFAVFFLLKAALDVIEMLQEFQLFTLLMFSMNVLLSVFFLTTVRNTLKVWDKVKGEGVLDFMSSVVRRADDGNEVAQGFIHHVYKDNNSNKNIQMDQANRSTQTDIIPPRMTPYE